MTKRPARYTRLVLLPALFFLAFPAGAGGAAAQPADGAAPVGQIEPGSGSFVVRGGRAHREKRITVFYHRPESLHRGSPVAIVLPGAGRNGDDYRDAWVEAAEARGLLVLSPSYPERYYPEYWSYNLAGMTDRVILDLGFVIDTDPEAWTLDDEIEELESTIGRHELAGHSGTGQLLYRLLLLNRAEMLTDVEIRRTSSRPNRDPGSWIFADFDRIFELAGEELDLEAEGYDLFGHSAGGQILHRLALFRPQSRARRIVAANSGWYTVPTFEEQFPYGLGGTGTTEEQLRKAFGAGLVVYLGAEDDEDETRGSVRRTPGADRQGTHRLARGRYFFRKARETAEALGADFEWEIVIVPGVGHDYGAMGEEAARYLYGEAGR